MQRKVVSAALVSAAVLGGAAVALAQQQAIRGQVRGQVVDPAGKGIPEVTVEMDLEGKHPKKLVLTTNKKGGYVRVGIPEGNYKLTFRKEGYKPAATTLWISLGGISEVPDVMLQPLGAAAAATGQAGGTGTAPEGQVGAASAEQGVDVAKVTILFDKANLAIDAGQWDDAEALLKEALAVTPNVSAVHYNLGWVYEHKKVLTDAANEYRQARDIEPTRDANHLALARVQVAAGLQDEARQTLAAAAAQFGQDASTQLKIGMISFDAGLPDQAIAAFEKTQALDPASPEPSYFLSMLALQKGQVAEACDHLEKYIGLTGQDPQNLASAKTMLPELRKSLPKR